MLWVIISWTDGELAQISLFCLSLRNSLETFCSEADTSETFKYVKRCYAVFKSEKNFSKVRPLSALNIQFHYRGFHRTFRSWKSRFEADLRVQIIHYVPLPDFHQHLSQYTFMYDVKKRRCKVLHKRMEGTRRVDRLKVNKVYICPWAGIDTQTCTNEYDKLTPKVIAGSTHPALELAFADFPVATKNCQFSKSFLCCVIK